MALTMKQALFSAISKGAPLYNAGRPDLCLELYRNATEGLLSRGTPISKAEEAALREALLTAAKQDNAAEGAWTLRRAFDSILDGTVQPMPGIQEAGELVVLDFERGLPTEPQWLSSNDGVMGGMSSSSLGWDSQDQCAVFSGEVTTANNGGFASVRTGPWPGWRLGGASALQLLVKGDGRVYKMQAKMDDGYDGVMYQCDFPTQDSTTAPTTPIPSPLSLSPAGRPTVWQEVTLPFSSFQPNFRGNVVPGRPPLSGARIRQLGLMVSKFGSDGCQSPTFRPGRFRLALKWVRGVV